MEQIIASLVKDLTAAQILITLLLTYVAFTLRKYIKYIDGLGTRMDRLLRITLVLVTEHRKNHAGSAFESVSDIMDVEPR